MNTVSKATQKYINTIETLTNKAKQTPLTSFELVRLINAKLNVSNKTLSGVYNAVCINPEKDILSLLEIMCDGVIPTFSTFKDEMLTKDKEKIYFSKYDGLLALSRLSKGAKAASKVSKQGGTITKAKKSAPIVEDIISAEVFLPAKKTSKVTSKA